MIAFARSWSAELRRSRTDTLTTVIALGVLAVTVERLWLGYRLPLWLDETWTAVISTQPTWAAFWREAWLDCNPPLYYLFERLWTGVFGNSNLALRLPSAIFFYLAASVPLLWTRHGLNKATAMTWSALMVLWWPGIAMTLDARGYGLLFLLSTCSLVAFMQLYRRMDTRLLLVWCMLGSLQILTHYFAAFPVAAQGVFLLWRFKAELVKRWYCALAFAPAFGWTYIHLPRLAEYAREDVVWYQPTTLSDVPVYALFTFGPPNVLFPIFLLLALAGALWKSKWKHGSGGSHDSLDAPRGEAARAAMLATLLAWVAILTASAFQASLTERYLVPLVPPVLLGVVLLARKIPRADIACHLVVLVYLAYAIAATPLTEQLQSRSAYGYERQSDFLAQSKPTHLVFLWDHPATKVLAPESLQQIGGFFLHRSGVPVEVTALDLADGENPNAALLGAVKHERTALLWLYDARRRSAAEKFPPAIGRLAQWNCSDDRTFVKIGKQPRKLGVGVLACVPSTGGNRNEH